MSSSRLTVPKIEINFDTPDRDRFLRDGLHASDCYSVLGRGSYGVVVKALYRNRPVAVKIVEKKQKFRCRVDTLLNEANVIQVKHANIVKVVKVISCAQYGLVVMERFDGHCLQNILNRDYQIAMDHKLLILCDIINGLCFCHRHQIVHLDVKPQNVIVSVNGALPHRNPCVHLRRYLCKLCDFGSSIVLTSFKGSDTVCQRGTLRYMAPELLQSMRYATELADIFSFGITMWQLNEGRLPYEAIASNEAVAYNVVKKGLRPDSIMTVATMGSPRGRTQQRLAVTPFRLRRHSDRSKEPPLPFQQRQSYHGSLLPDCTVSLKDDDTMGDVLKEQGIDVECSASADELDTDDQLSMSALEALFGDRIDISATDLLHITQTYRTMYIKCWRQDPSTRPPASEVRAAIHRMLEHIVQCKSPAT